MNKARKMVQEMINVAVRAAEERCPGSAGYVKDRIWLAFDAKLAPAKEYLRWSLLPNRTFPEWSERVARQIYEDALPRALAAAKREASNYSNCWD